MPESNRGLGSISAMSCSSTCLRGSVGETWPTSPPRAPASLLQLVPASSVLHCSSHRPGRAAWRLAHDLGRRQSAGLGEEPLRIGLLVVLPELPKSLGQVVGRRARVGSVGRNVCRITHHRSAPESNQSCGGSHCGGFPSTQLRLAFVTDPGRLDEWKGRIGETHLPLPSALSCTLANFLTDGPGWVRVKPLDSTQRRIRWELIARAVHDLSPRKGRTFVKLNCAAIPTGLVESERFARRMGRRMEAIPALYSTPVTS